MKAFHLFVTLGCIGLLVSLAVTRGVHGGLRGLGAAAGVYLALRGAMWLVRKARELSA